jgi:hypothetical protein
MQDILEAIALFECDADHMPTWDLASGRNTIARNEAAGHACPASNYILLKDAVNCKAEPKAHDTCKGTDTGPCCEPHKSEPCVDEHVDAMPRAAQKILECSIGAALDVPDAAAAASEKAHDVSSNVRDAQRGHEGTQFQAGLRIERNVLKATVLPDAGGAVADGSHLSGSVEAGGAAADDSPLLGEAEAGGLAAESQCTLVAEKHRGTTVKALSTLVAVQVDGADAELRHALEADNHNPSRPAAQAQLMAAHASTTEAQVVQGNAAFVLAASREQHCEGAVQLLESIAAQIPPAAVVHVPGTAGASEMRGKSDSDACDARLISARGSSLAVGSLDAASDVLSARNAANTSGIADQPANVDGSGEIGDKCEEMKKGAYSVRFHTGIFWCNLQPCDWSVVRPVACQQR